VRLSGFIDDDTYFHTVFAHRAGEKQPLVLTSDGQMLRVRNRLSELMAQEEEPDNKERYDFHYFMHEGEEIRFEHKITSFSGLGIYQPDNQVLRYLQDEQVSDEVYDHVKEKVATYWDHFDEEWFDIITAWIIHTYLVNGIGYTAYLMPKGKENTGKTTLQKLIARLSYNGFFSGKNTSAASSRIAHFRQATLNLDEFEKSAGKDIEGVFNNGQRKGGKYVMTNMNKHELKDQISCLKSFCPKTVSVNSTYPFERHFLSRNIILEATRTDRDVANLETMSESEKQEFQDLRNHLMAYCLFKHSELLQSIRNFKQKLEESGREADKKALICGIIRHFRDEETAFEVTEFLDSSKELQEDQLDRKIEVLFEEVISEFGEDNEQVEVSPKRLAERVNQVLEIDEEYQISPRGVGTRLRDYDVLRHDWQRKRSGPNGGTRYIITREILRDSLGRYELDELTEGFAGGDSSGSVPSAPSISSVEQTLKGVEADQRAVSFHDIAVESEYSEDVLEQLLDKMENEGTLFEPSPGSYKLLK
jgi:hypothetical protein